jgi:hypothetical protein
MQLFHISDNPNIQKFRLRPADSETWPKLRKSYVWAVNDEMVHNYYFPRNCPRVCRMLGPKSSEEEHQSFYVEGFFRARLFLEESWRMDIEKAVLYQYEFDTLQFYPIDYDAGYYLSEYSQTPISMTKIENPLELLAAKKIQVNFVQDLEPYRVEHIGSGYRFSNIRMKHRRNI